MVDGDVPEHVGLINSFRAAQAKMLTDVTLTEIAGTGLDFAKMG
jgi:hypothetical protein